MIAQPDSVVLTARVAGWVDEPDLRLAWIVGCVTRHSIGDWGDLDEHEHAANARRLYHNAGRLLSRYPTRVGGVDRDARRAARRARRLGVLHAVELDREVVEGAGHTGIGSVVQLIARKPS